MPISKRIDSPTGQIGIWRIDGSELEIYLQLFPAEMEDEKAKHPRTSLQRKASRLLISEMLGFAPQLEKGEDGKPFLSNSPLQISISHTDGFAAVMLGNGPVAVDVQAITPRIIKLKERFLNAEEQRMATDADMITLFWAAKETVYKYKATEKHDFREPITIHQVTDENLVTSLRIGDTITQLILGYRWLSGAVLVYLEEVSQSIVSQ